MVETQAHLFTECTWTTTVRDKIALWSGFHLQQHGVRQGIKWINRRHWRTMKKEIVTALWGAVIYHTCQARNCKLFRNINVNISFLIEQMQKEMNCGLELIQSSKRSHRCQALFHRLCN